ncbi:MAG: ATP-binding protein [Pseudonocardiaceae bacterium]
MPEDLLVSVHQGLDHVLIRLRGRLSLRNVPRIRETTVKTLLGTGRVVIDLSRLRSHQSAFVTVFPTALAVAGGWPAARLVLFGADAAMRTMLFAGRIPDTVQLAVDLTAARALLERRPPHVRRHRDLPMHNAAPGTARLFVREACDVWSVPLAVRETAELLSNELVSNAVEHACTSSRLTLTCTGSALRVSVRDYSRIPVPRPRPIDIGAFRGRGLHLVAALSRSWGVDEHADGKTVWVNVQLDASV